MAFIASPSDLRAEREATRDVVEQANLIFREHLDWAIELRGWEDTLPGMGRPQDLINCDVDACDVFLGLLWERWGQPTGTTDSGFAEEFQRARERHRNTQVPSIAMFFKDSRMSILGN